MQGKQGQADYKSFRLLCPSQNIGSCKFGGSIFHTEQTPQIKSGLMPKGVPFSGFLYMKGQGLHWGIYKIWQGNLSLRSAEEPKRCILYLSKRQDNFLCVEGVSFVILTKCDSKGVLFLSKLVYERVRGWTSGRSPTLPPSQYPQAGDLINCAQNSAFCSKYKYFTKHV